MFSCEAGRPFRPLKCIPCDMWSSSYDFWLSHLTSESHQQHVVSRPGNIYAHEYWREPDGGGECALIVSGIKDVGIQQLISYLCRFGTIMDFIRQQDNQIRGAYDFYYIKYDSQEAVDKVLMSQKRVPHQVQGRQIFFRRKYGPNPETGMNMNPGQFPGRGQGQGILPSPMQMQYAGAGSGGGQVLRNPGLSVGAAAIQAAQAQSYSAGSASGDTFRNNQNSQQGRGHGPPVSRGGNPQSSGMSRLRTEYRDQSECPLGAIQSTYNDIDNDEEECWEDEDEVTKEPELEPENQHPYDLFSPLMVEHLARILAEKKLEDQLEGFCKEVLLSEKFLQGRYKVIQDALEILKKRFPKCTIYPFGVDYIGIGNSEDPVSVFLDIYDNAAVVEKNSWESHPLLCLPKVAQCLKAENKFCDDVTTSETAVTFFHTATKLRVSLKLANYPIVQEALLIKFLCSLDPRVRPLLILARYWASTNGVFDNCTGCEDTRARLALLLMIFHLQNRNVIPTLATLQKDVEDRTIIDDCDLSFSTDKSKLTPPNKFLVEDKSIMTLSTFSLLQDFFQRFGVANLKENAVSLWLGKFVQKKHLLPENEHELSELYNKKLRIGSDGGVLMTSLKDLQEGPMCLQDFFNMGVNLTKNLRADELKRFQMKCWKTAEKLESVLNMGKPQFMDILIDGSSTEEILKQPPKKLPDRNRQSESARRAEPSKTPTVRQPLQSGSGSQSQQNPSRLSQSNLNSNSNFNRDRDRNTQPQSSQSQSRFGLDREEPASKPRYNELGHDRELSNQFNRDQDHNKRSAPSANDRFGADRKHARFESGKPPPLMALNLIPKDCLDSSYTRNLENDNDRDNYSTGRNMERNYDNDKVPVERIAIERDVIARNQNQHQQERERFNDPQPSQIRGNFRRNGNGSGPGPRVSGANTVPLEVNRIQLLQQQEQERASEPVRGYGGGGPDPGPSPNSWIGANANTFTVQERQQQHPPQRQLQQNQSQRYQQQEFSNDQIDAGYARTTSVSRSRETEPDERNTNVSNYNKPVQLSTSVNVVPGPSSGGGRSTTQEDWLNIEWEEFSKSLESPIVAPVASFLPMMNKPVAPVTPTKKGHGAPSTSTFVGYVAPQYLPPPPPPPPSYPHPSYQQQQYAAGSGSGMRIPTGTAVAVAKPPVRYDSGERLGSSRSMSSSRAVDSRKSSQSHDSSDEESSSGSESEGDDSEEEEQESEAPMPPPADSRIRDPFPVRTMRMIAFTKNYFLAAVAGKDFDYGLRGKLQTLYLQFMKEFNNRFWKTCLGFSIELDPTYQDINSADYAKFGDRNSTTLSQLMNSVPCYEEPYSTAFFCHSSGKLPQAIATCQPGALKNRKFMNRLAKEYLKVLMEEKPGKFRDRGHNIRFKAEVIISLDYSDLNTNCIPSVRILFEKCTIPSFDSFALFRFFGELYGRMSQQFLNYCYKRWLASCSDFDPKKAQMAAIEGQKLKHKGERPTRKERRLIRKENKARKKERRMERKTKKATELSWAGSAQSRSSASSSSTRAPLSSYERMPMEEVPSRLRMDVNVNITGGSGGGIIHGQRSSSREISGNYESQNQQQFFRQSEEQGNHGRVSREPPGSGSLRGARNFQVPPNWNRSMDFDPQAPSPDHPYRRY